MSISEKIISELLTLSVFNKIGPRGFAKLFPEGRIDLKKLSENKMVAAGIQPEIAKQFMDYLNIFDVDAELEKLEKHKIKLVSKDDESYPELLKEIHDPPYLLYIYGSLDSLKAPSLAVVGSRKHTHYGREVVEKVVPELVQHGITIVSGLALGIDALAHKAALDAGGKTVAIIGCGLDNMYPVANINLAREVIKNGGAIVSEYPLGTPPLKQHFPARNRIISGVSLGTLVVECDILSGAMITAHHCIEQNREMFAAPGFITNPLSAGPNSLLKMGAHVVTCGKDVVEEIGLFWDDEVAEIIDKGVNLPKNEQIIYQLLSHEPLHIDVIVEHSRMNMADVNSALLFLEIKGMVRNIGAAKYIKR
jgi:DNA processing protein